jgi:hypothetical protein
MLQLKRHVSKGAAVAVAAAAVIAAGSGIAVASASGSQITTAITIRLLAPRRLLDLRQCPASAQARGRR